MARLMIAHRASNHGADEKAWGAAFFASFAKSAEVDLMKRRLERRYGLGHLHFITCSCYRRMPLLGSPQVRHRFLKILSQVREHYDFALWGFVVMPEHIHLLLSEPQVGDPSAVMKALKQRVSRALRGRKKRTIGQLGLWGEPSLKRYARFWQRRFYDFNVWSARKRNEKLNYMHFNPVKRGLVTRPRDWAWSSYRFYWHGEAGVCLPNPQWEPKKARRNTQPLQKAQKAL